MTDALREELTRVGDTVPPVAVPGDLWARGRRARRRDRVVAGGAVLSVLLVMGGLGWVLGVPGDHDALPVAPGAVEAVPSVIHPVPSRLGHYAEGADETWKPAVAETGLAIGRASVAFASDIGGKTLPVVITATDGRYHLLRLPGWLGASLAAYQSGTPALALSPDGRQLAWGWYDRSTFGAEAVSAGVRVADLESGRVRTVAFSGGRGVAVGSISWSPDSRWLVWQGMQMKTWQEDRTGWQRNVAGRIAPESTASEPIGVDRGGEEQLAIDDHGTVSWTDGSGWRTVDRSGQASVITDVMSGQGGTAAAVSPTGRTIALADGQPTEHATFFQWTRLAVPDGDAVPFIGHRDLPAATYPEGATVEPLGWVDDDHVVALVTPAHDVEVDSGWTSGAPELAVMSAPGAEPAYDVVTRVKQGGEREGQITALTVAVDLMSLDRPTREFPTPAWPWSDERKVAVFGGAAVVIAAVLVFVVAFRRGQRIRG